MNSIELINNAWELRQQGILSMYEHDLYCYLIHRSEKSTQNPFHQSTEVLCAVLGINRNVLLTRRNKLAALGLITFKEGISRYKPAQYCVSGIGQKQLVSQADRSMITKVSAVFNKPVLDEIAAYCNERNNAINPHLFYDFYESKDWFVGKNKMSDWKAAIRIWEMNKKEEKRIVPKHDNNVTYARF